MFKISPYEKPCTGINASVKSSMAACKLNPNFVYKFYALNPALGTFGTDYVDTVVLSHDKIITLLQPLEVTLKMWPDSSDYKFWKAPTEDIFDAKITEIIRAATGFIHVRHEDNSSLSDKFTLNLQLEKNFEVLYSEILETELKTEYKNPRFARSNYWKPANKDKKIESTYEHPIKVKGRVGMIGLPDPKFFWLSEAFLRNDFFVVERIMG
jgi:hypothetical protein